MAVDQHRAGRVRLAGTFLRVGVMNEMQYRINFFLQLLQSLLTVGTGLVILAVIFSKTNDLGGWSRPQLLAVMGVFTLVGGIIRTFIQPNMQRVVNDVREGKLDFALTKPADAQLLVSVRDVRFWELTDVLVGLVVFIVAVVQMRPATQWHDLVAFVALLLSGLVSIYCFWLMLASASFWLVRINEVQELFDGLFRAGQYPVGIYPGWLRYGLTFIIPLAFAITVPAEAVTGRLAWQSVAVMIGFTIVLLVVSRWCWKRGLRRYGGASA
ncbi:MAG: ABC-2 family transporter protein [Ilumatobacteraceae bacterium]|nr:ABC-2 family transporter protein [Ilumatobacteraceae bacterium]